MKKAGRPTLYGPPSPYCYGGHRRTAKNTRWLVRTYRGSPYIEARCRVCGAGMSAAYRAHKKGLAKEIEAPALRQDQTPTHVIR